MESLLGRDDEGVVLLKSPLDPSKRDAAVEIQFSEVGLLPDGQSCGNREFEYGFFDESGGTDWATDCVVFLADVGNRSSLDAVRKYLNHARRRRCILSSARRRPVVFVLGVKADLPRDRR